ncbi:hypothetical protein AVEN_110604-1, partial [Araneus ventricosus]
MEALKTKRAVLRISFTKTATVIRTEIAKEDISLGVVKDKFTKLEKLQMDLAVLDDKILDLLIEARASEEAVSGEIEQREIYSDEFITLTRQVNEKSHSLNEINLDTRSLDGSNSSYSKSKTYKLPKLELKKFDGELLDWLPFWSQFERIHKDPDLNDSDKFSYLVQCMKAGSRAKEFIESYLVTSKNYNAAVTALKERFMKSDPLIEVYVRKFIKMFISNVKTVNKLLLDKLFDKIEAQLRALESLGLKPEENTSWLYPMVESSLTEDVLRAWQRSSLFNDPEDSDVHRLTNLMKFLKTEVEGEERLKLARSGFDNTRRKEEYQVKGENKGKFKCKKSANISTASGFLTTKDRSCIFCNRAHESKNCYDAR